MSDTMSMLRKLTNSKLYEGFWMFSTSKTWENKKSGIAYPQFMK